MSEFNSVHCNACGKIIEYPQEKEGSTCACPDCGNQVWFSQLAEHLGHAKHPSTQVSSRISSHAQGNNPPWTLGMLAILLLMNMYLGYMVIGLKKEVIAIKNRPTTTSEFILTSTNMIVPGAARQALSKATTNQELVDMLIEAVEIMDNEVQLQLSTIQNEASTHATRISELMELSNQLNTSIDSLYDDIANIGNTLDQLSTGVNQLQENQTLIQNSLLQSQ
jgi:methyl-accepting chemotaxis protein/DNA-directed RNA polymerase subunit RPC12/RpoP